MNLQKLLSFLGGVALVAIASGCASSAKTSPAIREVNAQTQFEELRDKLISKVKGAAPKTVEGSLVSLRVRAPNEATSTLDTAASDFARWCQFQGGSLYVATDPNKPENVRKAEQLSELMARPAGLETNYFTRACDVRGDVNVLLGEHVSLGVGGYPTAIRYDGFTVAWFSAHELKDKRSAAIEDAERRRVQLAAATTEARKTREVEAQAAEQVRRQTAARKLAVLRDSGKGTQLVCTGRQGPGQTVADLWYSCVGPNFGIVTFAEFSQSGWRLASQTLTPVQLTSGTVEHDASVVFEKVR